MIFRTTILAKVFNVELDEQEARDVLVALRRGCRDHLDVDDGGRGPRDPETCGSCRLRHALVREL